MEKRFDAPTGNSTKPQTTGRASNEQQHPATATICGLISQNAQAHPGRPAIIDRNRTVTYGQLTDRAHAIAGELAARGVASGSLVGVCMHRHWELAATLLGILQAGCAYVPLDPAYPKDRVRYMLEHSRAVAAIVDDEHCAARCTGVDELVGLNEVKTENTTPPPGPSANDLAYVIYTSGSTGRPKGVAVTHRNVVTMTRAMADILDAKALEGMLAATSVCFDPSVMEILGTLTLGGTVVLAENMLDLPALSAKNLVKSCVVVPSAIQALLASGWVPQGIRTIVFGSEALKQPLADQWFALHTGSRVFNAYGPTEDTVFSTATEIFKDTRNITIGKSVVDSRSYILDETMNPVARGVEGELFLAGNKLAQGYLFDEERTAERFISMKPTDTIPEHRLYRTGDLCRRNKNGDIEFLGRIDQQVKIRGFRIELEEVETALESIPGITVAAAAAIDGGTGQKILVAYIVSSHTAVGSEDIKKHLAKKLPGYMVPQRIIPLEELPLLPNGKLDRNRLTHLADPGREHRETLLQNLPGHRKDAIQTTIRNEVSAILNLPDPGYILADDSFDSLGLDSLSSLELSVRLSKLFNLKLSATVAMEYPSPGALSRHILERKDNGTADTPGRPPCKVASDTLGTFQDHIRSSHPTFQAAKVSSWSADDKSKLVREVLRMVNDQDRNPYSKVLRTGSATRGTVTDAYKDEEQEAIIWTTNLYLGLNRDKEVIAEAGKALQQFGSGMGTSAAASGMTDLHVTFEKEFAGLVGKPSACLFPTGYTANVGAVAGLLGRNDVVVIDQLCHASIVDGARLCGAAIRTFRHNSASDLEAVLKSEVSPYRTVLVVLEGVYSMGEGAAPVADIVRTAKAYGALVLVDEAHSFGFYGEGGAGICAAQGVTEEVDFIMTTLSKALGSLGGVVAARKDHIDLLKSSSRAYIFQASVSPADMAAALTALRRLREDDKLRERLWDTTRYMRRRFTEAGYDLGTGDGPIVTPHFSDKDTLYAIVQGMYKRGVQTSAVTYPIVENGRGRLRLICSSAHTRDDVDKTLDALIAAEHEVRAQKPSESSRNTDKETRITMQADIEKWQHDFVAYLRASLAGTPVRQTPDLVLTVRTAGEENPSSIIIRKQEITTAAEDIPDLPRCTLLLKDHRAVTALQNADVQGLLYGISTGSCVLSGQVEPFVWFMARIVEKQQPVMAALS